jgi:hypothetical protein
VTDATPTPTALDAPDEREQHARAPKDGHFLSLRDRQVLDAGPDPYATLDEQRRYEKRDERRAHQFRYSHVRADALARGHAALEDLWWLCGTMDAEFVRDLLLVAARPGVTWFEQFVHEAIGKAGATPVPASLGGHDEPFVQRILTVAESALAPADATAPRPRITLTYEAVASPHPLAGARPIGAGRGQRRARKKRTE